MTDKKQLKQKIIKQNRRQKELYNKTVEERNTMNDNQLRQMFETLARNLTNHDQIIRQLSQTSQQQQRVSEQLRQTSQQQQRVIENLSNSLDDIVRRLSALEQERRVNQQIKISTQEFGSNYGGPFSSCLNRSADVRKIIIRSGRIVNSLQFMLKDSQNSTTYLEKQGCEISHEKNQVYECDVPEGEYITQIQIRTGNAVDALTFITNTGKKSPQYGANGGGYHLINIPKNYRLCGYFGRYGHENAINKLGFFCNQWN